MEKEMIHIAIDNLRQYLTLKDSVLNWYFSSII